MLRARGGRATELATEAPEPQDSSHRLLGGVLTFRFGSRCGELFEVVDMHGNFVRPKSALKPFQLLGLVDTEVVAMPSLRARRLDRAKMEEFIGAGAPPGNRVSLTVGYPVPPDRESRDWIAHRQWTGALSSSCA